MLDYHRDIVADLASIFHVADWRSLDGPTLWAYVTRAAWNRGSALRAAVLRQIERDKSETAGAVAFAEAVADGDIDMG